MKEITVYIANKIKDTTIIPYYTRNVISFQYTEIKIMSDVPHIHQNQSPLLHFVLNSVQIVLSSTEGNHHVFILLSSAFFASYAVYKEATWPSY
jgi:hypothetical protein